MSSRAQGIFANREDFTFSILDFKRLATMMKRRGDGFFFKSINENFGFLMFV